MPGTLEFAWPWVAAALPLPLLVRWCLPAVSRRNAVLRVPFAADFVDLGAHSPGAYLRPVLWLAACAWVALIAAACRPQWLGESVALPVAGRNLMLAVDLSRSMQQRDMAGAFGTGRMNRLEVIQAVAGEFISRRRGDRIGLIVFGDEPYLQSPLTRDLDSVRLLLQEAEIGFLGKRTAIGDAIGLAIVRLRGREGERVLILLTDGENTAGEADPVSAARHAAAHGLRIYTIGVGATGQRRGLFGIRGGSELDEGTLTEVAQLTGGRYFRAHNSSELGQIYTELDLLERVEEEEQGFRPRTEYFVWPLTAALLLAAALLFHLQGLWQGRRS